MWYAEIGLRSSSLSISEFAEFLTFLKIAKFHLLFCQHFRPSMWYAKSVFDRPHFPFPNLLNLLSVSELAALSKGGTLQCEN